MPDADSLDKLDPAKLKAGWQADLNALADHYRFNAPTRELAAKELANTVGKAESWFVEPENREKVAKYRDALAKLAAIERNPGSMSYERERGLALRKDLEADRKTLIQPVDAWTGSLVDAMAKLANSTQAETSGPYVRPWTRLDWINRATMYGLTAVGFCLLIGLFTPAAALGAAGYLAMFYLSMPPWPGLPEGPMVEGHYLYVNKNLIEMFACLLIASTPNGLWVGLDALLFGRLGRRGRVEGEDEPDAT